MYNRNMVYTQMSYRLTL
nr:unnamed protein product [Callosobruchus analis]